MSTTQISRRTFLGLISVGGASFALGCYPSFSSSDGKDGVALEPNAFVRLDPDGTVTITVTKSEMGQGIKTGLAMIVAEHMDCDWSRVRVLQADGDRNKYGHQGTGGSSSTRSMHQQLAQMGAAARFMLMSAAAQEWGVDLKGCSTDNGHVYHEASGKSKPYGDLATIAAGLNVPSGDVPLKDKSEYRIIGKPTRRVDTPDIVTGKAVFAQDVKVPGATVGVVSRAPAFGASLRSFDDSAARRVPGVVDVVQISSGVAVLGENTWAAIKGRDALKVDWDLGPNASLDTAEIRRRLLDSVGEHPEMPAGSKVIEATYDYPYLAHYTMEPMNCVADVRSDSCTIWVPSQSPDQVQQYAAGVAGVPQSAVTVHCTLLGGGFGRRSQMDFVQDAVEASRKAKRPVKLLYTRDDDMRHDFYRPMSHHAMRGALDANGKPVGFNHQFISVRGNSSRAAGARGVHILYDIPGATMMMGSGASPIYVGAWRSVSNSQVNPSIEMFIDEMAHAAGKDPLQFRRENISDKRMLKILDLIEEKSGWGKPLPAGVSRGIALYDGYDARTAHVVEVSVEGSKIKVHRAVICIDTGTTINPMAVEMQLQGSCIDGISTALFAEVTIKNGGVVQHDPFDYEWIRMDQAPKTEVHIIESGDAPCGMGETGYPSAPAAVANAVFAATGKRVRKFPIRLDELV